jgi:hypothetical protein
MLTENLSSEGSSDLVFIVFETFKRLLSCQKLYFSLRRYQLTELQNYRIRESLVQ